MFTHHCRLIDGALAGVAVARALSADGDVSEAVEVLPQGQLVQEVVGSGLTSNGFHESRHHTMLGNSYEWSHRLRDLANAGMKFSRNLRSILYL